MINMEEAIRNKNKPRGKTQSKSELQLEQEKKREVIASKAAMVELRKSKGRLKNANQKLN